MAYESKVTEEWLSIAQGQRPWKWEEDGKRIGTETYPLSNVGFKSLSSNAVFKTWDTGESYRPRAAWLATSNWLACMGAQTKR